MAVVVVAVVKIAYTLWQMLTGNISVLDGLKKIGVAVPGFLLTPFPWVNTMNACHHGISTAISSNATPPRLWSRACPRQ